MVPTAFMPLAGLPVTANGKLDRSALPAPAFAARAGRAAASGTEQIVAGLFAQVLGREDTIGADDDFFELGGHSLLAITILGEVRRTHGVEVTPLDFYLDPTPAGLTRAIATAGAAP